MSFLYPRTVAAHRPAAQTGGGLLGYGGQSQATETVVATGLPASIQERREGSNNPVGLPSDATRPSWYIFIPRGFADLGTILAADVIVDDLGTRYQVDSPYWDSLGYRLTVRTLDV
jgi:hypothetical protein